MPEIELVEAPAYEHALIPLQQQELHTKTLNKLFLCNHAVTITYRKLF